MHKHSEVTFTILTLRNAGLSASEIDTIFKAANIACCRRTIYRIIARTQAQAVRQ